MSDRYKDQFTLRGYKGLPVGNGTEVRFVEIGMTPVDDRGGHGTGIEIRALVELRARVGVMRGGQYCECSICGVAPPMPDEDALRYILENHDGDRLVFPRCEAEFDRDERDQYPVPGWISTRDDGLVCTECATELRAARDTLRKKRRSA